MESQALATISAPRSKPCESPSKKAQLIRLWIGKLALNAGQALTPVELGVMEALWLEGFDDLSYDMLEAAFKKALKVCKFWPVKIADIREHASNVESSSTKEAAERAWEMVLDIRLKHWCPDAPGGFYGGKPQLSPRVEQACRASGVFREVETVNDLHVWARERFIESFLSWDDAEAGKYLLPDGEVKTLLAGHAVKMLPWKNRRMFPQLPPRNGCEWRMSYQQQPAESWESATR